MVKAGASGGFGIAVQGKDSKLTLAVARDRAHGPKRHSGSLSVALCDRCTDGLACKGNHRDHDRRRRRKEVGALTKDLAPNEDSGLFGPKRFN